MSDAQIEKVIADHAGTVVVDASGLTGVDTVTLQAHVVAKVREAEGTDLSLVLPTGSLTFDETALGSVSTGQDLMVSLKGVPVANLTDTEKDALDGKADVASAVDAEVLVGAERRSDFGGGTLTVSLSYTAADGEDTDLLEIWQVRDDGSIEKLGGTYDAKAQRFTFTTEHLSRFVLVRVDGSENPFTDLRDGDWFKGAALWAYRNLVMRGYGGTTLFGSGDPLTTERFVAIVANWLVGDAHASGDASRVTSLFVDSEEISGWARTAAVWATDSGLLRGYPQGDGTYRLEPQASIPRERAAAILWNAYRNGLLRLG